MATLRGRSADTGCAKRSGMLAEHGPQHGLGQLTGGVEVVDDMDHGLLRVDDAQIDDGADLDRDLVARNNIRVGTSRTTVRRSTRTRYDFFD